MSLVWFVTGSSSGLGLETVTQLSDDPQHLVIASCRNPDAADDLRQLRSSRPNLHIVKLDVSAEQSIRDSEPVVKSILGGRGIDFLLNNAAVCHFDDALEIKWDLLMDQFATNVAGPAILLQVYLPYLRKGARKVVVNYTSGLSTINVDLGDKASSYAISKAALNMLTYKQAKTCSDLICFCLNPGTVMTGMSATCPRSDLNFLNSSSWSSPTAYIRPRAGRSRIWGI